ncbi:hypothetical protein BCR42DRAFT_378920 [Absidia repens]|uniref:Extracellular membrane protein CFEM domain-containing protein n=1 Tax=Absidia repens TaxID=90262 RepID=A0A1X2IAN2_9FUNG|nr:hypothetical protein BCR42DRAFT_378920 [Absidia repens]
MQLLNFFTGFTFIIVYFSFFAKAESIDSLEGIHQLFKREDKLPFDSLPAGNCTAPKACSSIEQPATCHCNGILTVCQNAQGQFCWGSKSLNQGNTCPAVPSPCKDSFNGTASCLCNSEAVLCVDQHNHYCYGNIDASSSVSLAAIPTGPQVSSGLNGLPSNTPMANQSGSANAKTTSSTSFATQLIISTQQIGWMVVLAFGTLASMT